MRCSSSPIHDSLYWRGDDHRGFAPPRVNTLISDPERAKLVHRLAGQNDPLLRPLIEAADDEGRERAIDDLLASMIRPLLASLLARFRRQEPSLRIDDFEEISSIVTLRVIKKLRAAAQFEEHAVAALESYIATLGYNTLYDFRRQRHPERHRLKKALRYLFTHDPRLALWDTAAVVACGLRRWSGSPKLLSAPAIEPAAVTAAMEDSAHPADAVYAMLVAIGGPVAFDELVSIAADLWNVRDVVLEHGEFPPDAARDQLAMLEDRQYVESLWQEIRGLAANQRAALLLNLRDLHGGNALTLFLLLGVASVDELASAVGVTAAELQELWEDLPLDDLRIAARLGLSRQQIINLRKSARARLARRMARNHR